jgi:hypothetical protein
MKNIITFLILSFITVLFFSFDSQYTGIENNAGKNGEQNPGKEHLSISSDLVGDYIFSQAITAYTSINTTGRIIPGSTNCDDNRFGTFPIGFNFTYNGNAYTTFGCSCNGYIMMGAVPGIGYFPLSTDPDNEVNAPFAYDLMGSATGGMYYQTTGTAPNRVCTIEWYQWGFYASGGNELSFQIKLIETSNAVQFIYKPRTSSGRNIQVGIRGASSADFANRTTDSSWLATNPGTSNTATCRYNGSLIPSGLTFTWTPPPLGIIGNNNQFPNEYRLYQNYPNPFNPRTKIIFQIAKLADVKIVVFDIRGREVETLVNEQKQPGIYEVDWNAANYPSGVYFYRLETESFKQTQKMILNK